MLPQFKAVLYAALPPRPLRPLLLPPSAMQPFPACHAVGLSNIIVGLSGSGNTGSYIFTGQSTLPLLLPPLQFLPFSMHAVGLSNIIVGLSGSGYTGSYIFSQTIFSMRAGVSGYMHGAVIFALEAAIFLVPFQGMLLSVHGLTLLVHPVHIATAAKFSSKLVERCSM